MKLKNPRNIHFKGTIMVKRNSGLQSLFMLMVVKWFPGKQINKVIMLKLKNK